MPDCNSGILSIELPHRNAMLQTHDMTPYPTTGYRHRDDLMCFTLILDVTLKATITRFNVIVQTQPKILSQPSYNEVKILPVSTAMMTSSRKCTIYIPYSCKVQPAMGPVACKSNMLYPLSQRHFSGPTEESILGSSSVTHLHSFRVNHNYYVLTAICNLPLISPIKII